MIGLALASISVGVAAFGPWFAPYSPTEIVGIPYGEPSGSHVLGLDYLGRDAFSRFLWGGRTAIVLALSGVLLGCAVGVIAGLLAAYLRGWPDAFFNRTTEVLLVFPSLVFILVLITAFGSALWLVVVAVAAANAPRIARVVRAAALDVRVSGYVEVAEARGERRSYVMVREMLPNMLSPIGVDFGIRVSTSIILVAGISFLGLGLQPPNADWGLIVSENRSGITIQPWVVVAPIVAIAMLTIGINLVFDGLRRQRLPEASQVEALS